MCRRARMARGMVHPAVPSTFTFGDFQIDPAAGELRKRGRKLRIPQQSVQMLAILVAAAGEIVTREQLRDALAAMLAQRRQQDPDVRDHLAQRDSDPSKQFRPGPSVAHR